MKRIYCELHMFDLHQKVYIVDIDTGDKECVAMAPMEELPEVISAISNEKKIDHVYLSGNSVFGKAVSEDILAYSKMNYSKNNIVVEVIK